MRARLWSLAVLISAQLLFAAGGAAASYEAGRAAHDAGDYREALTLWEPVADSGDARAQYGLGVIFERGMGAVQRDLDSAARWYFRAGRQGHPTALNNLGLMYAQGRGVGRDPRRAARLWLEAAQAGHLMAMYNLGLAYYRAEGLDEDPEEALHWFRQAAEAGLADGQYALAQLYSLGVMVEQDDAMALAWYDAAAAQGHDSARARARALRQDGVQAAALSSSSTATASVPETAPARSTASQEPLETAQPQDQPPNQPLDEEIRLWIGSLDSEAGARRHWDDMRGRFPAILGGGDARFTTVEVAGSGTFYRVLAGPFDAEGDARAACAAMRAERSDAFCQVVTPAQ